VLLPKVYVSAGNERARVMRRAVAAGPISGCFPYWVDIPTATHCPAAVRAQTSAHSELAHFAVPPYFLAGFYSNTVLCSQ